MSKSSSFFENPSNTREEILRATFIALSNHGYADLTIDRIDEEFEKSKSLIYHHYDGKDDLLLDLLQYILDSFEEKMPFPERSPDEHLRVIVEYMFQQTLSDKQQGFNRAMVELRAQAAHDPAFHEHFAKSDEFIRKQFAHVVRAGIERGVFQQVDPDATAALFQTVLVGVQTKRVSSDDSSLEETREEFERYVEHCLLTD